MSIALLFLLFYHIKIYVLTLYNKTLLLTLIFQSMDIMDYISPSQ